MFAKRIVDQIPFFYGWIIVAVCALGIAVMFGIRLSFSVFFVALIDEFGWSRGDTSIVFSMTMVVFMLSSTAAGAALDRWGAHWTFSVGAAVLAIGLILSTQIETLLQLTVTYGVIGGLGITILGLTLQASLIGRWFRRKIGTAIGIAFAGTGIGSFFMTPFMERVISAAGWRTAYFVLAAFILGMIPLYILFLRQTPQELGLQPDGERVRPKPLLLKRQTKSKPEWTLAQLIKLPTFWLLIVAGFCTMGPVRALTVHQLAMMEDVGVGTDVGARVVGLAGATTAVTFIVAGILSDRIGRVWTYALGGLCLVSATIIMATLGDDSPLIWVYAILFGMGEGSRSSLVISVVADMFAGQSLGRINGSIGASFGAGAALYPWLTGVLFDQFGSYGLAHGMNVVTAIVAIICLAFVRNSHYTR